jgi:hypothetical protein
MISYGFRI